MSSITHRVGHSQNKHLGHYPVTKLDNIKHETHTNAVTWPTWANHTLGSNLGFLLFKLALHRKHYLQLFILMPVGMLFG